MSANLMFFKLQTTLACYLKSVKRHFKALPVGHSHRTNNKFSVNWNCVQYPSVLLLFVFLKIGPWNWLVANTAECNVSSTVDLMGGEVSHWDVTFANKVNKSIKVHFLLSIDLRQIIDHTHQFPQNSVLSSAIALVQSHWNMS